MDLVVIPLILVVLAVLLWTWWAARAGRDPVSSVDSFNRALSAMQPLPGTLESDPGPETGEAGRRSD